MMFTPIIGNSSGCKSDCSGALSGWNCSGGSHTSPDICTRTQETTSQSTVGSAVVGSVAGASAVLSMCNISSPQGLWMSMNQFQIILLLLLTKSNMPSLIVNYLTGLKATTCSFNFIPFGHIPGLNKIVTYFDSSLSNSNLDYFGITSGSTIVNNFAFMCILIIIGIIHSIFACIHKCTKRKVKSEKGEKCLHRVYQFFTFSVYIRLFIEVYQFLLLSCTSELKRWNTSTRSNIFSLVISIITASLCIGSIILSFLAWRRYKNTESMDSFIPLKELFSGIRANSLAKLYSTIFLFRRALFVSLLIFGGDLSNLTIIILMLYFQVIYLSAICITHPFKEVKSNIVEISNECFYLLLLTILLFCNSPSTWTDFMEKFYLGIILTNSFTIISILVASFCVSLIQKIKKKCAKSEITPKKEEAKVVYQQEVNISTLSRTTPSNTRNDQPSSSINFQEESKVLEVVKYQYPSRIPSENEIYWQSYNPITGGKRIRK